jgi:hypothetical protein
VHNSTVPTDLLDKAHFHVVHSLAGLHRTDLMVNGALGNARLVMRTSKKFILGSTKFRIGPTSNPCQTGKPFEFISAFIFGYLVSVKENRRQRLRIRSDLVTVLVQGIGRK